MNNKNILIAGVIAIGLYLFSQQKKTVRKTPDIVPIKKMAEKMAAERLPPNASPTAEKELAEKIYDDIMARRAAAEKKIAKKIPEASTPAARRKIAEKKAAAAAVAAAAAAAAAAEKAAEKASKNKVSPTPPDNFKKENKTPEDIKKKFGSWDTESEGQETSHKSTEQGYSKKKTTEDIMKDFGLWALLTPPQPKSKLKLHAVVQKDNLRRISVKELRSKIAHAAAQKKSGGEVTAWKAEEARRVVAWKAATQKRRIAKIRSAIRRPMSKLKRR